jgi:phage tail-like protein
MNAAQSRQRFLIEIEDVRVGTIESIENLSAQLEILEYKDGDDLQIRKRPGRASYGDVTLKKGVVESSALWDWWQSLSDGKVERKKISVILADEKGNETLRWVLHECWPSRWELAARPDPDGPGVLFEAITFVVEKIELVRKRSRQESKRKR